MDEPASRQVSLLATTPVGLTNANNENSNATQASAINDDAVMNIWPNSSADVMNANPHV